MTEPPARDPLTEASAQSDDLAVAVDSLGAVVRSLPCVAAPERLAELSQHNRWQAAAVVSRLSSCLAELCCYAESLNKEWPSIGLSDYGRDELSRLSANLEEKTTAARELRRKHEALQDLTGSVSAFEEEIAYLRDDLERLQRLKELTDLREALLKQHKKLQAVNREVSRAASLERKCEILMRDICKLQQECLAHVSSDLQESVRLFQAGRMELEARRTSIEKNRDLYATVAVTSEALLPIQRLYFEANRKVSEQIGNQDVSVLVDTIASNLEALDQALSLALQANESACTLSALLPVVG